MSKTVRRKYGREAREDKRDKKFLLQSNIITRRRSRTWSTYGWHGDQGKEGSCVGFGWCHWLHSQPIRQYVDPIGIYKLAQHLDEWEGTDYDGTSIRAGAKVLSHLGAIQQYRWTWDAKVIANHVLIKGPVVIGVKWYNDMNKPDSKGLMSVSGKLLGGHCVLIMGYNGAKKLFKIKNSYGTGWGNRGYAYISFDDLQRLLHDGGEACVGIESKMKPKSR